VRTMDDAALVERAREGDRTAWAAIYDRYADRLHDHCHRILRDRDEAADALHDAFLAASRNLHQLRDPSRLRPWLYSICRHESLRRARRRARVELTDEVDEVTGVEVDHGRATSAAELQELVWAAAAGLNERDQALLDLNLRQGLEGQDLADAMGTSVSNVYVLMSRLRDQVERSLGALLIARLGREDCAELDGLLAGWDGRFTPLMRKRVARHVDRCDVCTERRATVLSPAALLAAAPLVPAPDALRARVLDALGAGSGPGGDGSGGAADGRPTDAVGDVPIAFTRTGFAAPPAGARPRRRTAAALLGAAAVAVAALVGVGLAADDDEPELVAVESPLPSAPAATPGEDEPATTATSADPTTTEPSTASTPEVAQPTTPPEGASATTTPPVAFPPPTTTPPDTTPPTITSVTISPDTINLLCASTGPYEATVTVVSPDAVSVEVTWGGDLTGSAAMTRVGSTWTGVVGPFPGTVGAFPLVLTVTARDGAGNLATRTVALDVQPCAG